MPTPNRLCVLEVLAARTAASRRPSASPARRPASSAIAADLRPRSRRDDRDATDSRRSEEIARVSRRAARAERMSSPASTTTIARVGRPRESVGDHRRGDPRPDDADVALDGAAHQRSLTLSIGSGLRAEAASGRQVCLADLRLVAQIVRGRAVVEVREQRERDVTRVGDRRACGRARCPCERRAHERRRDRRRAAREIASDASTARRGVELVELRRPAA